MDLQDHSLTTSWHLGDNPAIRHLSCGPPRCCHKVIQQLQTESITCCLHAVNETWLFCPCVFFFLATELLSYSAKLKRLVLLLCLHVKYEATVLWKMYRQLSLIPLSLLADVPMVYIFKILGYSKVNLWPRGHWDSNSFLLDSPKVSYVTSFSTWASTLPTGRGDDNTPSTSHGWGVKTATLGWA